MGRIRDDLAQGLPTARCCRMAVLNGMMAALPATGGRLTLSSPNVANALLQLAKDAGVTAERLEGRQGVVVDVSSGGKGPNKRRCCRRSWLRGTFLVGGTLTDPHKGYNLEWALPRPVLELIEWALRMEKVRCRLYERTPGHWICYSRNAEDISTILAMIGAGGALLEFEAVRVEKDLRNQVHRQVNYETANLQKTVATGLRQAEEIARMRAMGLLDGLPEPLLEAARLREQHPYASLVELCAMTDPPVSKSGMNHRLRKLHAIMRAHSGEPAGDS